MMNATISVEINKGVQRKSGSRLHILPAVTIVVLLYTLVMTLTWLRDQTRVSLVTRPYTATVTNDDAAMTSTILTTLRGWLGTAVDSAQSVMDSEPVQAIRDTALSVMDDFRNLVTADDTVIAPSQESLWIRYLPLEDASKLLAN
jgi:hypothetical protein